MNKVCSVGVEAPQPENAANQNQHPRRHQATQSIQRVAPRLPQPPSWNRLSPPDLSWHDDGMNRIRLSTTVDASLLEHARSVRSGTTDAALIDEALAALLARYRSAEVDASYAAYDEHPLEEPDEWGDLASFRRAVASS